jgi:hypothetical protein
MGVIYWWCLDCQQAGEKCETCLWDKVCQRWQVLHGYEPPPHLWHSARKYGCGYVARQVIRKGYRHDVTVRKGPNKSATT